MTGVKPSSNLKQPSTATIAVKKIPHEGWLLHDLHHFIRTHERNLPAVKDTPVRFGGNTARPLSDVVFDFRQAGDVYRLAEKVVRQGMKRGDEWHGYFKTPRLAVLPEPVSYDRAALRADFKACTAYGEKGARILCPSLQGISAHAFAGMRKQGAQIVSLTECWLSGIDQETFNLSIRSSGIMPYAVPLRRTLI